LFKVINVDTPSKSVSSFCYDKQQVYMGKCIGPAVSPRFKILQGLMT